MDPLLLDIPDHLTTDRLYLRVPTAQDGALVYGSVRQSLPALKEWMPWASDAYSTDDAEVWCRRAQGEFILRRTMHVLVFPRSGSTHLGTLGAMDFDWTVRSCEIGYWLCTDQTGHGYMTEAVDALATHVATHLGMRRIRIRCDPRNEKSAAVARRCGFAFEGTHLGDAIHTDGTRRDTHVFARRFLEATG